jgi:hypothetical protein
MEFLILFNGADSAVEVELEIATGLGNMHRSTAGDN